MGENLYRPILKDGDHLVKSKKNEGRVGGYLMKFKIQVIQGIRDAKFIICVAVAWFSNDAIYQDTSF